MLPTENTLRSRHLLLLLLVGSSVLLGLSYLNEMYQRIQLQTDLAIVERQSRRAVSEKSVIQHKATQLQIKLEAADNDKNRIQQMHEFQFQQQNVKYETEKQELLKDISIKEKKMEELQDQFESLKMQFDSLHSVMEQFQKNQSRLLENFATQSTRCMNVISMMSQLCNKEKKIPLLFKKKNTKMNASSSQPSTVTNKPENNSVSPYRFNKSQMTLMQTIETISLPSGAKPKHMNIGPEVNDVNLEPETTGSPKTDGYNATAAKVTAQESKHNVSVQKEMNSTVEPTSGNVHNQSFRYEGKLNEIIKNSKKGNITMQLNTQEKWISDSHEKKQKKFGDVNYSEHVSKKEGISQEKQHLQLAHSHNLTSMATNLTLSEATTQETTIGKNSTEVTPKVKLENTTLNVGNTEENFKDKSITEEKVKYKKKTFDRLKGK